MQLKEGYKQTEIGIIPEDWDTPELGDLGSFKNGVNKDKESFGFGFPFVNLMDVFGKPILDERVELELLDSNSLEHELYGLKKGDVLFVRSSVKPSGVGLTCLIPNDLQKTVFSGFLIRYRENQKINLDFKRHCFYEERFRQRIIASSTVSANTNINQEVLKKIRVALPPTKEEQQAIATALSEVDTLITSLDKIITKKKAIKQGAMQQLLKSPAQEGKRLPGFDGNWVEKELDSIIYPNSSRFNPLSSEESVPCIELEHLSQGTGQLLGTVESKNQLSQKVIFNRGDVLFSKLRPYLRKFYFADFDGVCSSEIWVLKPKNKLSNHFLYFLIQTNQFLEATFLATGTKMPRADWKIVKSLKFRIPPSFEEQEAIASILSDMDKDLKNLEQKKSKYIRIKQGMMQELLTGKTRLI